MNYVKIGIKYPTNIFIESFLKGWCTLTVGKISCLLDLPWQLGSFLFLWCHPRWPRQVQ